MCDEERYILRGYDPETYGSEYIKDEDVVRPSNHKFSRRIDWTNKWLWKSTADHETYGTCDKCFDSGPVWQTCQYCGKGQLYVVFFLGNSQLDSITLSESLERGLRRQKANRTCIWRRACSKHVDVSFLQQAVGRNRQLSEEDRTRIFDQVMGMLPYDERTRVPGTNM